MSKAATAADEAITTGEIPDSEELNREVDELIGEVEGGKEMTAEEERDLKLRHLELLQGIFDRMMEAQSEMIETKELLKEQKSAVDEIKQQFNQTFERGPSREGEALLTTRISENDPEYNEKLMDAVNSFPISVLGEYDISDKQVKMLASAGIHKIGDFTSLTQSAGNTWHQKVDGIGPGKREKFEDALHQHMATVTQQVTVSDIDIDGDDEWDGDVIEEPEQEVEVEAPKPAAKKAKPKPDKKKAKRKPKKDTRVFKNKSKMEKAQKEAEPEDSTSVEIVPAEFGRDPQELDNDFDRKPSPVDDGMTANSLLPTVEDEVDDGWDEEDDEGDELTVASKDSPKPASPSSPAPDNESGSQDDDEDEDDGEWEYEDEDDEYGDDEDWEDVDD